jgi:hypothetical protein
MGRYNNACYQVHIYAKAHKPQRGTIWKRFLSWDCQDQVRPT